MGFHASRERTYLIMTQSPRLPTHARCFVTGGGSGLGRALCLSLARRGARLAVADLNLEAAEETCRLAREAGAKEAQTLVCDVRNKADLEDAAAAMKRTLGGIDLLVNNAGVAVGGDFLEISGEDWDWLMSVNLDGVVRGCRAFLPMMREQGSGRILNIASAAGFANPPGMAPYNVSKAAVISLSESLYCENAEHGIHVTVVCPTFFPTRLVEQGRMVRPEIRKTAHFLLHETRSTAEGVASASLRDLEAGRLYSFPMTEARVLFLLKRFFPKLFQKLAARQMKRLQQRFTE
jgi:NAD(P)-dependent dehydrogenase (short-subunit alcohol dehydrogenase family)